MPESPIERTGWLVRYEGWLRLLARQEIDSRFAGKFDSSDAVQQTLFAAWQNWDRFRGGSEAQRMAWLRQILAHQLANLARHYAGTQSRAVDREQAIAHSLLESTNRIDSLLPARDDSPSAAAINNERRLLLADALETLPEDYRKVILLRNVQELSYGDIANQMGRSEGAVRMLWVRALTALREKLTT